MRPSVEKTIMHMIAHGTCQSIGTEAFAAADNPKSQALYIGSIVVGYVEVMPTPLISSLPTSASLMLTEGHIMQAFDAGVSSHALHHVRREFLAIRNLTIAQLEAELGLMVEASFASPGMLLVVGQLGDRELVEVNISHGSGSIRVATDAVLRSDQILRSLCEQLAAGDIPDDPRVPITFWTLAEHGPDMMRRRLHAPTWEDICDNYVGSVRSALTKIMQSPPDSARGIALWQGAPGTGKTTALRALAREWRDEVDVHVIVDPEVFLGERASYLVDVLFGQEVDEPWQDEELGIAPEAQLDGGAMPYGFQGGWASHPANDAKPISERAKLIVLEDAGELISSDARVSAGQALSRLLNLTDGMLGQGANVSVLVTTNEPIERLHDAVARPGRSWAHVEFGKLSQDDANRWLEQRGIDERVEESATLAELYSLVRGDQIVALDNLGS